MLRATCPSSAWAPGSTSDALSKLDPAKLAESLTGVIGGILDALGGLFLLVTLVFFFVVAVPGFVPRVSALRQHASPSWPPRWPSS